MANANMKTIGFLMIIFIVGLALVILYFIYPTQNGSQQNTQSYTYFLLVIGAPMMGISAIVIWHEFFK